MQMRRPRRRASLTETDRHLGARLRLCRTTQGLSLQQLSAMVGIAFQQTHKYERAQSRMPAGLLAEFARVLGVPPAWFYEGLNQADDGVNFNHRQRLCLELSRHFAAIDNVKVVDAFAHMARTLAEAVGSPAGEHAPAPRPASLDAADAAPVGAGRMS